MNMPADVGDAGISWDEVWVGEVGPPQPAIEDLRAAGWRTVEDLAALKGCNPEKMRRLATRHWRDGKWERMEAHLPSGKFGYVYRPTGGKP